MRHCFVLCCDCVVSRRTKSKTPGHSTDQQEKDTKYFNVGGKIFLKMRQDVGMQQAAGRWAADINDVSTRTEVSC